jgi:N-acetylglucosaminyldiphosphoundecaprenol N-acetyl-beta-D-mannosaminyltransferase
MSIFYFNGIKVTSCNIESAHKAIIDLAMSDSSSYVCVTESGNIVNAIRNNENLKNAINNSAISLPDGRPLSVLMKIKGDNNVDRVSGPDIMVELFKSTQNKNIKHYFLGDTEATLQRLVNKINIEYPLLKIVGAYSPPFCDLDNDINNYISNRINKANADIIWVGLGGGKQEVWMYDNYRKFNKGVMIGVGAAFRFYLGDIRRAPKIMQYLSLEWLFRLLQQPQKMFYRYLKTLPIFVVYFIKELIINKNKSKSKS